MRTGGETTGTRRMAVHWWAVATALSTFVLLFSGGLVTSKGVGMSVPDWPTTYGYNMFLFPYSRWVGGIFYEHSHRLIASGVGLMTLILTAWLFAVEPRRWVRIMGMCAFVAVCVQGVLGGLRVTLYKDEIGIFHAMLAQSFFVLVTLLAIITSRRFIEKRWADYAPDSVLRKMVLATTCLIFVQLGIAATMRHEHVGLAIPDFPLAYGKILPDLGPSAVASINISRIENNEMPVSALQIGLHLTHRFTALLIAAGVAAVAVRARHASRNLKIWTHSWMTMILLQIGLGAWTIWSNKAADVATAHMALGALSLLLGAVLSFRLFCGARTSDFILPDAPRNDLMVHTA